MVDQTSNRNQIGRTVARKISGDDIQNLQGYLLPDYQFTLKNARLEVTENRPSLGNPCDVRHGFSQVAPNQIFESIVLLYKIFKQTQVGMQLLYQKVFWLRKHEKVAVTKSQLL